MQTDEQFKEIVRQKYSEIALQDKRQPGILLWIRVLLHRGVQHYDR